MEWTTTIPTVSGFYWVRGWQKQGSYDTLYDAFEEPLVVEVVFDDMFVPSDGARYGLNGGTACQWKGPLNPDD